MKISVRGGVTNRLFPDTPHWGLPPLRETVGAEDKPSRGNLGRIKEKLYLNAVPQKGGIPDGGVHDARATWGL